MIRRIPWRPLRIALRVILGMFVFVAGWLLVVRVTAPGRAVRIYTLDAAAPAAGSFADAAPTKPDRSPRRSGSLRIVTFNIAHGRGLAYDNYNGEPPEARHARLIAIGELLRSLDADAVVLNEVDFDSNWSGGVDQARAIATAAGYPHVVEQNSYDAGLPFWRLRFGNAALSRHPIDTAERVDLPAHADWESLVAGHKRALACTIRPADGDAFRLIAVHLEHRSEAVRIASADVINGIVERSDLPVIVAGDFNSTPPHFPHAEAIDGVTALGTLLTPGRLAAFLPDPPAVDDFTFRADKPAEVIDWVLVPPGWRITASRAVPTELSDHRPVVAEIEFDTEPRPIGSAFGER